MRYVPSVLLSLGLLAGSIGAGAAQNGNVCVHAADGAIVCGPVASNSDKAVSNSGDKAVANPFDQPAQTFVPPSNAAPPAAAPRPLAGRPPVRHATREVRPPPKQLYRQPPPRDVNRRPPPPPDRRIAREDARRLQAERDHRPPPRRLDREPPMRFSDVEQRRHPSERRPVVMHADRDVAAHRYDSRLRELEREVRALRAEREQALRHVADRRPPPRELRRDERERYAPPPRRAARDRYSNED